MAAPNVLIADDNPGMRIGIKGELLKAGIENVVEISQREEIFESIQQFQPSLIIMGDRIRDKITLDLVGELRSSFPMQKILVSGVGYHEVIIWSFLKLGIRGYILKDDAIDEIALAVKAVINGEVWISSSLTESIVNRALVSGDPYFLSQRELMIIHMLSKGKKEIDIARSLKVSERTVRYSLKLIYSKINVETRIQVVSWAASQGLI